MIFNRISTLLVGLFLLASTGHASTVDLSFTQLVSGPTGWNNPLLDLKISDTAVANQLTFTISATGLTGVETLNGIALNLSSALASTLTGVSISNQSPLTSVPSPFSQVLTGTAPGGGSAFSPTQILQPGSPLGGNFDFYLKIPVGQLSGNVANADSFTLTFTESNGSVVTPDSFLNVSAKNGNSAGGYYAMAALTNSTGVAASGLSYVAVTAVPELDTMPMLLSGMGLVGMLVSRRRRITDRA
jgi:hypothetical protein